MLKSKATKFLKRITLVLASMAKAKTLALKSKTHALKTRLMIFFLLRDKKILMSSISHKLHSIMGQQEHDKDQEDGDNNMGEQSKSIVLYNHGSMSLPSPTQMELLENADEQDNIYGYGYGYGYNYEDEDDEEKFPDLTHSLFESEDLDFEDPGGSVIDLVKNSKKEGEEFRLEDEIDHVADLFIKRVHLSPGGSDLHRVRFMEIANTKICAKVQHPSQIINLQLSYFTLAAAILWFFAEFQKKKKKLYFRSLGSDNVKKTSRQRREVLPGEPNVLHVNIEAARYGMPIAVQMQAIPIALSGKSLLASAGTGSGKLLPIWLRIKLSCLVTVVVGGDNMAGQLYHIQQGVELIVGTPGRLIDLVTKHDVEPDICSRLVDSSKAMKQLAIWVALKQKKRKLFDILMRKQHFLPPVVVYMDSRLGADLLSNAIMVTAGLKALSIHGPKSMKERREIMRSLLVGEVSVIVATGVLGWGVDLLEDNPEFKEKTLLVFRMNSSVEGRLWKRCPIDLSIDDFWCKSEGSGNAREYNQSTGSIPFYRNIYEEMLGLNVYGLYEVKVSGDGNCQFRALSDQMYKSPEHHKHIRKEVVKQLKDYRSLYEGYVPMKYKRYYKKMAKSGEWGDHVTLQAAADKYTSVIISECTTVENNVLLHKLESWEMKLINSENKLNLTIYFDGVETNRIVVKFLV
ncbi:hypothetical protein GH714_032732 [Hevea brasiliensis]|uniref:OTU domain-containing protein n=1 Tax=Hevea brasiliensis TaxID=3981 RepID=A0A6A6NC25_HEVBR|nr:hypothetical protein GH714_032732 [Hevea brasiliensis]